MVGRGSAEPFVSRRRTRKESISVRLRGASPHRGYRALWSAVALLALLPLSHCPGAGGGVTRDLPLVPRPWESGSSAGFATALL